MTGEEDQDSALRRSRALREEQAAEPDLARPPELAPGAPDPRPAGGRDARPRRLRPASSEPSADGAPAADDAAGEDAPPTGGTAGPGSTGDAPRQAGRTPRQRRPLPSNDDEDLWSNSGSTRQHREAVPEPKLFPTRDSRDLQGNRVRIGLWGAPRSGKTTVIAAMPIAAMRSQDRLGRWLVSGVGGEATKVLTDNVERLVSGRFPPPTDDFEGESIMWSFQGKDDEPVAPSPPPSPERRRAWGRGARKAFAGPVATRSSTLVDFTLELQDVNGEAYGREEFNLTAVEHLAQSRGLIYVFDPVYDGEAELESFKYFYRTLQHVTSRVTAAGKMDDGLLPHHVSVLITKFDDPTFFKSAADAYWLNRDQTVAGMPYVPIDQGALFFDWVCDKRQGGTAPLVRDALRAFFHQDRIEYFACSAIGFRLNPNGVFDYDDFVNVETVDGKPRIRSEVRPVNVLEPLIRLERRIRLGLPAVR